MRKTGKKNSDIEIRDTYNEILDLIVRTYEEPPRKDFEKQSRCAQLGYDLLRLTISSGLIAPGDSDPQMKLRMDRKEAAVEAIHESDKG